MVDKKISELDPSGNLTGNETFEHLQVGSNVRSTLTKIKDWIATALSFDSIKLNTSYTPVSTVEGEIYWNGKYYTPQYDTGLGITIRDGDTEYWVFYNDTGAQIPAGKVMHLLAGAVVSGEIYPTYEYADASNWEKVQGTLAMTMHTVPVASLGVLAKSSQKIDCDTSGVSAATQLFITDDGSGDFTDVPPAFPSIAISIGASRDSDANGSVFFNQTTTIGEIYDDAWDGAILETFDFTVSSNGTVVTGSLENVDNTRDLPIKFSGSLYTFDTTPAATVTLTAGTDSSPTTNYVYIPKSTKVLTVSTSGFPITEHAKVAQLVVQSAATLQTETGAVRNQNINDHLKTTDDNGHILHIAERIRQLNAQWDSGTEATLTGTTTNGYIQVTSGDVWQMHKQTVSSFSMPTDSIQIVNDNATAYRRTTNLNTITAYSDGTSWNNEWSKIVVWGVANKTGEKDFYMCNLPSAGYNSEANAVSDALNYADYSIPDAFKGVGYLVAAFAIRVSGGTITYNSGVGYQDLRGFFPNSTAGGGGGGGITTLLGLTDVATASYSGKKGQVLRVNTSETDTQFRSLQQTLTSGTTETMDLDNGLNAYLSLAHNITLTLSNLFTGAEGNIIIDNTGSYTLTISPTPKVFNSGGGVVSLTASSRTIVSYYYDGTSLNINYANDYD